MNKHNDNVFHFYSEHKKPSNLNLEYQSLNITYTKKATKPMRKNEKLQNNYRLIGLKKVVKNLAMKSPNARESNTSASFPVTMEGLSLLLSETNFSTSALDLILH